MNNKQITKGFTAEDSRAIQGAMETFKSTLTIQRIVDLKTAQTVIGTTDAFINTATFAQIKALGIIREREYWRMGVYMDKSGHAKKYASFADFAKRTYNMSAGDISVKYRTSMLIDDTGLHSIFPIEEVNGVTRDYSATALGIIMQHFTIDIPTGKKLKNGKDEFEKSVDINAAMEAHNSRRISPFMSISDLKKALKAQDVDEVADTADTAADTADTAADTADTPDNTAGTAADNTHVPIEITAAAMALLLKVGDTVTLNGEKYIIIE